MTAKVLEISNFGSYKKLRLDLRNRGLTLVYGPTGSGKSTLCDALPWVLYGKTAKDGAVDEVLSWPGNQVTEGKVYFDTGFAVCRKRGPNAKDNDLWYIETSTGEIKRGKDLADTQKLINAKICDPASFLAAHYYHEFANAALFFTANGTGRRKTIDALVDFSFTNRLDAGVRNDAKTVKTSLLQAEKELLALTSKQEAVAKWRSNWETTNEDLQRKSKAFDILRRDDLRADREAVRKVEERAFCLPHASVLLDSIRGLTDDTCGHCGSLLASRKKAELTEKLTEVNKLTKEIEGLHYKIRTREKQANPYEDLLTKHAEREEVDLTPRIEQLTEKVNHLKLQLLDLDLLSDVLASMRTTLVKNTIEHMQTKTNALLTKHFDAEIRVEFEAQDGDKIETRITKDGNQCTYAQLSKGQRQLLKLCFGISLMEQVANRYGLQPGHLFFDEAFDGIDEGLKSKVFGLLSEIALTYPSVFVVEHSSALKAMFENQIGVELKEGHSALYES